MAKGDVFHALKHAYRQKILRTLRRRPRTYSTLLAKVEPDGEGTGSFNYHLKVLKDAGLVEVDETLYRPTPNGFAALQLLAQAPEGTAAPPRRRVRLAIVGSLIGVGGIGLLLLLSSVLAPVVLDTPGPAIDPGWNIPVFVSERIHEVSSPQVAVDPKGDAVVIWAQDDGAQFNIWANRLASGVGWGAPTRIEKAGSGDAHSPMLAIDPTGTAWAVWSRSDGLGHTVWANRFVPGAEWGEATLVSTDGRISDIAVDANGALTIVWRGNRPLPGIVADRFIPDVGWVGATQILVPSGTKVEGVQVAVDAAGRAIAVWSAGPTGSGVNPSTWEIYASRYVPNAGWGPPIVVGAGEGYGVHPSIAMDSEGRAIALWMRDPQDVQPGLFAARFVPGFGWSEAVQLEDLEQWHVNPQLALDAQGNAIVVWTQRDDDQGADPPDWGGWVDLVTIRFDLDVGWGDPIRIADKVGVVGWATGYDNFALAMEPGGSAVVLYDDNRSGIFAIQYLPGEGWGVPSRIGSGSALCDPEDLCPPAAAIDPAGNVVAVWQDRKSEPFGLLASHFEEAISLEALARELRDQLERNQMALEATSARMAIITSWLAVSLSLLVATMVLTGVLFVVYWNPRRGLAAYRKIPDDSGEPPGPGG